MKNIFFILLVQVAAIINVTAQNPGIVTLSGKQSPPKFLNSFISIAHPGCSIYQITTNTQKLCRKELSVFYAGMEGLGSAWGRAANEPAVMNTVAVLDIQGVLGNARDALTVVTCIPFDIGKLNTLISRIPSLSNIQAVAEIETLIKELQIAVQQVQIDCNNGATLSALFVTAVHVGAAQAWASSRICMPSPMPAAIQTVILNHLSTASTAFAAFLPCVPGFSLSQFSSIPVGSMNSAEPLTNILGLHTNILWNIALTECCCNCSSQQISTTPMDWYKSAVEYRGKNYQRFTFICPKVDYIGHRLYGTDVYTDDCSICAAGVHTGAITYEGGTVTIEIRPGLDSYPGSTRNGAVSNTWGSWPGSFVIIK